jgi:hypothetical protein
MAYMGLRNFGCPPSHMLGWYFSAGWDRVKPRVSGEQLVDFTAKVEELCGEFLQAIGRDQYSPAEVIQAACNLITAAVNETCDKDLAIQAMQQWLKTSLERAKNPAQNFH